MDNASVYPLQPAVQFSLVLLCMMMLMQASCSDHGTTEVPPGVEPPTPPVPTYFDHPAWHPQGTWIAAEHADSVDTDGDGRRDAGFAGIWLVHSVTGVAHPLLSGFGLPAWSPDGRRLAVVRGAQVFTITVLELFPPRIDSSSLTQLTTEGRNFYPAWSPDGQWIAYDNTDCGGGTDPVPLPNSCGVLIVALGGQSPKLISRYSRLPSWHPVKPSILFTNRTVLRGGEVIGDTLWVYDVQISLRNVVISLTEPNYDNQFAKYSPDGGMIAFFSKPRTGAPAVWVMNSDGSSLRRVSPDFAWRFDWSPDRSKFVFVYANYQDRIHPGNGQLWVVNTDGSSPRQLTHFSR